MSYTGKHRGAAEQWRWTDYRGKHRFVRIAPRHIHVTLPGRVSA